MLTYDEQGNLVDDGRPETGFNSAMQSPYAAMFGTAMGNLGIIAQGGIPQQQPFSAAFDVRRQNALLMDQKFQRVQQQRQWQEGARLRAAQTTVAEQTAAQQPNPLANLPQDMQMWELSGAKARGLTLEQFIEAKNPHYATPNYGTANMQDFAMWQRVNPPLPGEAPEAYQARTQAALDSILNPPALVATGGGGYALVPRTGLGGAPTSVVDASSATAAEATLAGDVKGAEKWSAYNAEFAQTAPSAHSQLRQLYGTTLEIRDVLNDPTLAGNTGLLQGRLGGYTDKVAAQLETLSNMAALPALKEAGLAPVTGSDVELVRSTFASLLRDPEANKGAIEAQIKLLEQKIASLERAIQYYNANGGDMRGYLQSSFKPITIGGEGDDIDITDAPAEE